MTGLVALVPLKRLRDAKSRLGPGPHEELVLGMARRVVRLLVPRVDRVVVVSPQDLGAWARRYGADFHLQQSEGLNPGLEEARRAWPARGLLVVLPDLPALKGEELDGFLERWEERRVLAAPDHLGRGTNLLLCHPAEATPFRFGPDSLARHSEAEGFATFVSPGTAWDLDTPDQIGGWMGPVERTLHDAPPLPAPAAS